MSTETQAIEAMETVLEPLEAEARKRVIDWAAQKYRVSEQKIAADGDEATKPQRAAVKRRRRGSASIAHQSEGPTGPVRDIVNLVRSHKRAETIEQQVLDRPNQLNRVLVPLFIVYTLLNDQFALTARDLAEVLRLLGGSVAKQNVLAVLRGPGARFVTIESDGPPRTYKLNTRGARYMETLLSATGLEQSDKDTEQVSHSLDSKPEQEELELTA